MCNMLNESSEWMVHSFYLHNRWYDLFDLIHFSVHVFNSCPTITFNCRKCYGAKVLLNRTGGKMINSITASIKTIHSKEITFFTSICVIHEARWCQTNRTRVHSLRGLSHFSPYCLCVWMQREIYAIDKTTMREHKQKHEEIIII